MVKDRTFALNYANFWYIHARARMPAGMARTARYRAAIESLANKKDLLRKPFKLYFLENYFTNFNVLRFNSTFTFLPNVNEYACTLVLPT